MILRALVLCLSSFITIPLSAEYSDTRSFRVLGYGEGFFEGVYFRTDPDLEAEKTELEFLPNQKSRLYRISASMEDLSFHRLIRSEGGSELEQKVGAVRFSKTVEHELLIFFETKDFDESGIYEILQLDESADVWRAGCIRFLNLSGAELNCRFGERAFELPHKDSGIIEFEPEGSSAMVFQLTVPLQGTNQIVYSSRTKPDPNHPKLLVIKPPFEKDSLKVRVETLW